MGMHKGMCGPGRENNGPSTPDVYLRDYIARKTDKPKLTFEDFLRFLAQRENGTYPYGYDPTRSRDFEILGTTPQLLEIVWKAAQENV